MPAQYTLKSDQVIVERIRLFNISLFLFIAFIFARWKTGESAEFSTAAILSFCCIVGAIIFNPKRLMKEHTPLIARFFWMPLIEFPLFLCTAALAFYLTFYRGIWLAFKLFMPFSWDGFAWKLLVSVVSIIIGTAMAKRTIYFQELIKAIDRGAINYIEK